MKNKGRGSDNYQGPHRVIVLLVAVLAVSSASILALLSRVPGSSASFWRMIISSVLIMPLTMFPRKQHSRDYSIRGLLMGIIAGLMLGIHMSTWLESLAYASVAVSTTIVCTHSLFSSLFSILLGEPPKKMQLIGITVSLIGLYFLSGADPHSSIKGILLALIGAISGGVYFTLGRVARSHISLPKYLLAAYSSAALVSFFFAYMHNEPLWGYPVDSWIYLFLLALIPNFIGHSLLNFSLRYSTATTVTGSVLGEPLGATILAMIILEQIPPLKVYVFMTVILAGVAITVKSGLEL